MIKRNFLDMFFLDVCKNSGVYKNYVWKDKVL